MLNLIKKSILKKLKTGLSVAFYTLEVKTALKTGISKILKEEEQNNLGKAKSH